MSYSKPPGKPRQGRAQARQPSRGRSPSAKPSSVRTPRARKLAGGDVAAADPLVEERAQEREPRRARFPIVGMGASAGGLEAFESFFAHMPPDRGVAFVLVPHLDPTHESLMAELISRHTAMKVQQSRDGTRVEPNGIYLIPPNAILTIQDGILHVAQPEIPRGYRTPINTFFRSLAEDQGRNAICIILSGTGSDGALGFRAIKEHGGMAIAQAEGSAKYQGMPRSAFATGLADWVLPVEEMPGRLLEYVEHLNRLDQSEAGENMREEGRKQLTGTGVYLQPPAGTPDLNLINMARQGLRRELRAALHQAISEKKTIVRENVRVESDGGERTMERELEDPGRQLSTTIEDLEISNEELKSSNEELMSMNEELQSTVEELETSKEELQSVNEELETVNSELSGTLEEIGRINSDLKNLLESTEIATIFLDRNLRIKRYTPRALDLFQLIPGDVGRPLADIAPKHDYDRFADDVEQVLEDLVPKDHPVRSGGGRVYMMRILPYRTVDNVNDGVVINFVEVSQLDEAKREIERLNLALRYRVAELETVFNLLPIGMALCEEPSGEYVRLNRRGAQLLGVPQHMNVSPKGGEHLPFSYHKDGRPLGAAEDPIQRVLDTGKPVEAQELRLIHEDGRELDLIIAATPLLRAGDKVRGAVASMVDVTERNFQEQELKNWAAQQTAIAELGLYVLSGGNVDQLSDKMVETASKTLGVELAEVFTLEPDGSKLLLKAATGWSRELVGKATVPGDLGSQAGFTLRTRTPVIVTDLREETRFNAEFLREHGVVSGMTVVISGSAGPYGVLGVHSRKRLRFSDDDLTFLQALANLISMARIRAELLENQRQMLMREAEEKTRRSEHLVSLGTLAAGIAHEINNPLNAILVNAEYSLLSMDRQDPAALEQSLRTIAAEAKRCGEITNSVLTFSKAEGAPKGLHDLNQVVRKSMDLVGSYLRLFEAVVDLDLDQHIPLIRLNPTTMEHALINLLRNAVEASVGVKIRVRTERLGNRVELTVTDNGPGIPTGDLKRIFDPFFTRRSDSGGTGLGLNLVYRIITDHDGTIEARNAPGGGAMFVIDLPIEGEGE